jgi:hypothetical protein
MTNPNLQPDERERHVRALMDARRAVQAAKRANDPAAETAARREVDRAKRRLGERGDPWWSDGAPDYNRRLVAKTPYADWYAALASQGVTSQPRSANPEAAC